MFDFVKNAWVAMRPSHWVKNLILLLPLIFSERAGSLSSVGKSLLGVVVFSLMASAVYVINDRVDKARDQLHPVKKDRPSASDALTNTHEFVLAGLLILTSLFIGISFLTNAFCVVLGIYLVLNVLYSVYLKNLFIVDVVTLASFYVLRIVAGLVVIDAPYSHWMVVCMALLALFIGLNKRRSELKLVGDSAVEHRGVLAFYKKYYIHQMVYLVSAAILICYTLYTIDAGIVAKFGTRNLIWSVPFVCYGIFRYLYLVNHRNGEDDPIKLFLGDKPMMVTAFFWVSFVIAVIYLPQGVK